jgi:hypothetical protein
MSLRANASELGEDDTRISRPAVQGRMFVAIYIISVSVALLTAFAFRQLLRWALT